MPFKVSGPPMMITYCDTCPPQPTTYTIRVAAYRAPLETEALTGPEPGTLHPQLPIMPWVMEAIPQLGATAEVSLLTEMVPIG